MNNADVYRVERENGLTYQEIANKYGVSKQRVAQICGKYNPVYFRVWKPDRCKYPNVRKWLNENKITVSELIRKLGLEIHPNTHNRLNRYLTGKSYPNKQTIDKLLALTGLTYEQFFETDHSSEKAGV